MENFGENRALHIKQNICILGYKGYKLTGYKCRGYVVNHVDTRKLTFVRQKSTKSQKKSNFYINKTFRALKIIAWSISSH